MRHRSFALVAALSLVVAGSACGRGSGEDAAYDIVKAKAKQDLGCDDVTVKKMAQDGAMFEYQAKGCDDLYTYGVDCDGGCKIVAGVRGQGIGGLWNKASGFIDKIEQDFAEHDKRAAEMRERNAKLHEQVDADLERTRRLADPASR